jgi:hypothetical protein
MTRRIALVLTALLLAAPAAAQDDSVVVTLRAKRPVRVDTVVVRDTVVVHDTVTVTVHDTVVVRDTVVVHDTVWVPQPPPADTTPTPPAPILPPGAEHIIGPQVPIGESPWPAYDSILVAQGPVHQAHYLAAGNSETWYYDLGLVLYIRAARMNDTTALRLAREAVAQRWVQVQGFGSPTGMAPRSAGIGSLMLWALDGHGNDVGTFGAQTMTVWEMLAAYARHHVNSWIVTRLGKWPLHYGLRDGGYALLYAAQLAAVHPDPTVRAELRDLALVAARDYYAPRQYPDGGWYWGDSSAGVRIAKPDGTYWLHSQPFMVGLMLDGMVATHQLTQDTTVARAIIRGAEWLHRVARVDTVAWLADSVNGPKLAAKYGTTYWRGHWYFVFEPGTPVPPDGTAWDDRGYTVQGAVRLRGGWDTNTIREVRQNVPEAVHALGYAYQLTGDARFRDWGDEMFAASFGKGQGPLADPFYCLPDYIAKNYNQAYRSSGTYLARRQ